LKDIRVANLPIGLP